MGSNYGNLLGKIETLSIVDFPLWWLMGCGWNFGRINGAGMILCVFPSLLYMP